MGMGLWWRKREGSFNFVFQFSGKVNMVGVCVLECLIRFSYVEMGTALKE